MDEKLEVLCKFSQKMTDSESTLDLRREVMKSGITRYYRMILQEKAGIRKLYRMSDDMKKGESSNL